MKKLLIFLCGITIFASGCGKDNPSSSAGVFDRFNRADSTTTLGNAETGQAWTTQNGTWGINSGAAHAVTTVATAAVVESGKADGTITVTLSTNRSDNGLIFRSSNSLSYWYAGTDTGRTGYGLAKFVNTTVAALVGSKIQTVNDGDIVSVTLSGANITVLVNGVSVITATDGFNQTATQHGIGLLSPIDPTSQFKNFMVQ